MTTDGESKVQVRYNLAVSNNIQQHRWSRYRLYAGICILCCCNTTTEEQSITSADTTQSTVNDTVNAQPIRPPLPTIPMKTVGDPNYIGSAAIEFTDVTNQLLPTFSECSSLAFVDFDDDGWPDLLATTDRGLVALRNVGGAFEELTEDILFVDGDLRRNTSVVSVGDADGDGDLDIYMGSRTDQDILLLNDGLGHFDHLRDHGLPKAESVGHVHFVDINRDGHLDLYVTRGRQVSLGRRGGNPGFDGSPNVLLLNDGNGEFQDVTEKWSAEAGLTSETFGAVFADFDRDGDEDALVVRDFEPDHYLQNMGGSLFEDRSLIDIDPVGTTLMGVTVGDVNGDGRLDIYASNGAQDYLYAGQADGGFKNIFSESLGTPDPTAGTVGWGCALIDLDNDGDQDLISVAADADEGAKGSNSAERGGYTVLENKDGKLYDVTSAAGLDGVVNAKPLAAADFDLDGDIDIVIGGSPGADMGFGPAPEDVPSGIRLLRNDSARAAGNRFLYAALRSERGNHFAVGAILDIEVGQKRTSRVVTAGTSYQGSHSLVQHFGLGSATHADRLTINWPDGNVQVIFRAPAGYHRFARFTGECCFPGESCEQVTAECPLWDPTPQFCNDGDDCDPCEIICSRFAECGEKDIDCTTECAKEPPADWQVTCVMDSDCSLIMSCLDS
jgi:hypothetical protein